MPNPCPPSSAAELRRRMDATGIGYAGIDGVWWRPGVAPLALGAGVAEELHRFGAAVFALFDVLADLYETDEEVRRLLDHAIPPRFTTECRVGWYPARGGGLPTEDCRAGWYPAGGGGLATRPTWPALMVRPDFQLVPAGDGYRLAATELEMCPAAQGFAHAMQVAYGLATDLADRLAEVLAGRPLLIVGTEQWSEFLFEQLALCRALAERGATAYVLYDRPIAALAAEVAAGARWVPPLFGVPARPTRWDTDVLARLRRHAFAAYVWPGDWPATVGNAVVFRFGYLDCFAPDALGSFARWSAAGATFLNPPIAYRESKSVLAAVNLPAVRARLAAVDPDFPTLLDRCLPATRLLTPDSIPELLAEREAWLIKYAGFDGGNRAWGGRSLQLGRDSEPAAWQKLLCEAAALPWPVVAQRLTPSARLDVAYYDEAGHERVLSGATTRLRSFLLRDATGRVDALGTHLTAAAATAVAESVTAVQTPIRFER